MKIVHLLAGAGPMYCGSCLHGNTLAAGPDVLAQKAETAMQEVIATIASALNDVILYTPALLEAA